MVFLIKGAVDIENDQELRNVLSIVDMAVIEVPPNEPSSVGSKYQKFLQAVEEKILQGRTSSIAKRPVLLWMRHLHKNAHKTLKEVSDQVRLYHGTEDYIVGKVSGEIKESIVAGEQQQIAGDQCRRELSAFSTHQPWLQGLGKIVDNLSDSSDWTFRHDLKLVSLWRQEHEEKRSVALRSC